MARLWANLELSASFVSCEKAFSHRCLCLTLTRKYRCMIKSDVDQDIGDYIAREQRAFREMTEALRRVWNSEMRIVEYDVTIIKSPLETPLSTLKLSTRWSKTKTRLYRHRGDKNKLVRLSLSWKFGNIDFSKMHISLEKSDRWSWLEPETTRSTQQS